MNGMSMSPLASRSQPCGGCVVCRVGVLLWYRLGGLWPVRRHGIMAKWSGVDGAASAPTRPRDWQTRRGAIGGHRASEGGLNVPRWDVLGRRGVVIHGWRGHGRDQEGRNWRTHGLQSALRHLACFCRRETGSTSSFQLPSSRALELPSYGRRPSLPAP